MPRRSKFSRPIKGSQRIPAVKAMFSLRDQCGCYIRSTTATQTIERERYSCDKNQNRENWNYTCGSLPRLNFPRGRNQCWTYIDGTARGPVIIRDAVTGRIVAMRVVKPRHVSAFIEASFGGDWGAAGRFFQAMVKDRDVPPLDRPEVVPKDGKKYRDSTKLYGPHANCFVLGRQNAQERGVVVLSKGAQKASTDQQRMELVQGWAAAVEADWKELMPDEYAEQLTLLKGMAPAARARWKNHTYRCLSSCAIHTWRF